MSFNYNMVFHLSLQVLSCSVGFGSLFIHFSPCVLSCFAAILLLNLKNRKGLLTIETNVMRAFKIAEGGCQTLISIGINMKIMK